MDKPAMIFVGRTGDVATSPSRRKAFEAMGFDVTSIDLSRFVETGGRWVTHFRLKFSWGPGIRKLNRHFVRLTHEVQPSIIWVDKGQFIWPESIQQAREVSGAVIVHLNPDDPFGGSWLGWKNFIRAIPAYDIHAVARDVNIAEYYAAGAKQVVRYHWAYDPAIHRPMLTDPATRTRLGGSVGFIGDWEDHRERSIVRLAEAGIPVRVWGPRWTRKCTARNANLRIESGSLIADEYAKAICAFDINLGFLRKINRDQSTTRSVEIPACGGFLLAERTAEHLSMFVENEQVAYFESDQELISQAHFFTNNPERRRQIAFAGRQRCISSGYDHLSRQRRLFEEIKAISGRTWNVPFSLANDSLPPTLAQ